MLAFNAERHEYTWDGRRVPGVTSVLQAAGMLNFGNAGEDRLEWARERGRKVHRLCELDAKNDLDEDSVDESFAGYLEADRRFRRETGFVCLYSELRVFHESLGYAGTLDDFGRLGKEDVLLDRKTGKPQRATGPQTAAYLAALMEGKHKVKRYALHLNADGTYTLHPLRSHTDFAVFCAALTIYNWKSQ